MRTGSFFVTLKCITAALLCALAITACTHSPAQIVTGDLLLTNANIVDPSRQEIRHGALVITDGRISAELAKTPANFSGQIVDLNDRWVIPGLIDMHVHAFGNRAPDVPSDSPGPEAIAQRVLYAGITGYLDLFGYEDTLIKARARQASGEIAGADIFASLSCLTATNGHCTEYGVPTRVMDSPDEAREVVDDLAQHQPDVIKIVYQPTDDQPSIDKPTFRAAVAAAQAHKIPTIVHLKTWQDISDAIDVGATAVTHVPNGKAPDDLPVRMAEAGLVIIPTLAVETELTQFVFDSTVLNNSLARAMTTEEIISSYSSPALLARWSDREARWRAADKDTLSTVGRFNDAGVSILAGTDAGNWGTIQGFSLHRELIKLTEAGLTPWQALASATTNAGDFLGIENGVHTGSQASLVVLDASPIEDIANTQKIHLVIHHGKIIDRLAVLTASFEERGSK